MVYASVARRAGSDHIEQYDTRSAFFERLGLVFGDGSGVTPGIGFPCHLTFPK